MDKESAEFEKMAGWFRQEITNHTLDAENPSKQLEHVKAQLTEVYQMRKRGKRMSIVYESEQQKKLRSIHVTDDTFVLGMQKVMNSLLKYGKKE